MKNCNNCKHAEWEKTSAGYLHPAGNGTCKYPFKVPALPQAMYWIGRLTPRPYGGHVHRRVELKDHCIYYDEYKPIFWPKVCLPNK